MCLTGSQALQYTKPTIRTLSRWLCNWKHVQTYENPHSTCLEIGPQMGTVCHRITRNIPGTLREHLMDQIDDQFFRVPWLLSNSDSETACDTHKTIPCLAIPTSPLILLWKMTPRQAKVGTLKEQFCHMWRFLMCLIGYREYSASIQSVFMKDLDNI